VTVVHTFSAIHAWVARERTVGTAAFSKGST